jgi:hypothetical protein
MNVFEFVLAIVLIVTIGSVIRSRQGAGHRRNRDHDDRQAAAQPDSATAERIEALEERVAVLERIVTDRGYELRQKFRDLEE